MEYEEDRGILPLSQVCYTKFPKYVKSYEVEKSVQIPIVDVSDMLLYREIARAIKSHETKNHKKTKASSKKKERITSAQASITLPQS